MSEEYTRHFPDKFQTSRPVTLKPENTRLWTTQGPSSLPAQGADLALGILFGGWSKRPSGEREVRDALDGKSAQDKLEWSILDVEPEEWERRLADLGVAAAANGFPVYPAAPAGPECWAYACPARYAASWPPS